MYSNAAEAYIELLRHIIVELNAKKGLVVVNSWFKAKAYCDNYKGRG